MKEKDFSKFDKMTLEETSDYLDGLKALYAKKQKEEKENRKKLKPDVERWLGRYILKKIGLSCYALDPAAFKLWFESLTYNKADLKLKTQRSAKHHLDQVKRMGSKSGPNGYVAPKQSTQPSVTPQPITNIPNSPQQEDGQNAQVGIKIERFKNE